MHTLLSIIMSTASHALNIPVTDIYVTTTFPPFQQSLTHAWRITHRCQSAVREYAILKAEEKCTPEINVRFSRGLLQELVGPSIVPLNLSMTLSAEQV